LYNTKMASRRPDELSRSHKRNWGGHVQKKAISKPKKKNSPRKKGKKKGLKKVKGKSGNLRFARQG